ncbi:NAD(P)/FAD-dependent oxidoreductase [Natrinema sp. 74]|uniref:NAD(P)/FAD-dependent oxidoreductase n=1 Tax=Natrinema sp. 74 TaxID=3384159 RepID=UPI0038D36A37
MTADAEVIVVGGGCIGSAIARELASDHDVMLLERDQLAAEATSHSSGLVNPELVYPDLPKAGEYVYQYFETLDGVGNFEYIDREMVCLAAPDRVEDGKRYVEEMADPSGYDVTWQSAAELEERYPDLFNVDEDEGPIAGGMVLERTGWVEPYTFTTALAKDAEKRGATIRTGVEVTDILVEDGAVTGVETTDGVVRAPTVVTAAGWRTRQLVSDYVQLPIQAKRYWSVNLTSQSGVETDIADEYPIWYDEVSDSFWRPERNDDDEIHISGVEGIVEQEGSVKHSADEEVHRELAIRTPELLDEFSDAAVASDGCCPTGDAQTPDWLPIVDSPDEAPDGLVLATGFSGLGITGTPVGVAAVRELVSGYGAPFPVSTFALDRFDDRSTDFESTQWELFDVSELETTE